MAKTCVRIAKKRKKPQARLLEALNKTVSLKQLEDRATTSIDDLFRDIHNRGGQVQGKPGEQYAFLDNGADILAVAHTDTVQTNNHFVVSRITGETIIHNPKLDDRLGVYTILDLLPKLGIQTDILLTENEEIGQTTARQFKTDKKYNWLVEFDRAGTDAVLYQYDFEKQVKRYFKVGQGIFSDISDLGHLGCQALNIGVGYHNCHSNRAFMVLEEYIEQLARFIAFYNQYQNSYFPHTELQNWDDIEDYYYCETCEDYFSWDEIEEMAENGDILCPICLHKLKVF